MEEPKVDKSRTFGEYFAKRKRWTQKQFAAAGGPLGNLVKPETIIHNPRTKEWIEKAGAAGEANIGDGDTKSKRTGNTLAENTAHVFDGSITTALHEGLHLLRNRDQYYQEHGVMKAYSKTPEHKVKDAAGKKHTGAKDHPFMEAADLYNASNKKQAIKAKGRHSYYLDAKDVEQIAKKDMAAAEYDLGARLMFDPGRGHTASKVLSSAMESVTADKKTYKKYRDEQSFIGRGSKERWQYFAGK